MPTTSASEHRHDHTCHTVNEMTSSNPVSDLHFATEEEHSLSKPPLRVISSQHTDTMENGLLSDVARARLYRLKFEPLNVAVVADECKGSSQGRATNKQVSYSNSECDTQTCRQHTSAQDYTANHMRLRTVRCHCTVEIDVLQPTNSIVLHAWELHFESIHITLVSIYQ